MIAKDLRSNVLVRPAVYPVALTNDNTAQVSAIIDRQGYQSVMFVMAFGSMTDAGSTVTPLLEEGDNSALSDNSAVADADMHGTEALATVTQAHDNQVRTIGYRGNKRYLRLTLTPAGNDAGTITMGAVALLGDALAAPVSQTES